MFSAKESKDLVTTDRIMSQAMVAKRYQSKGNKIILASLGHPTYAANLNDCFAALTYWKTIGERISKSNAELIETTSFEDSENIINRKQILQRHLQWVYTGNEEYPKQIMAEALTDFYGLTMSNGFIIKSHNIIFTIGGAGGLHSIFNFLNNKNPNGYIITPTPHYTLYSGPQEKNKLITIDLMKTTGYRLTPAALKAAINNAKKSNFNINALLLCNPYNPLGTVISKKEWDEIIEILQNEDFNIIFDEPYAEMNFTKQPLFLQYLAEIIRQINSDKKSFATATQMTPNASGNTEEHTKKQIYNLLKRTLILRSATKALSTSGERQGLIISFDPEIIQKLTQIINNSGKPSLSLQTAYAFAMKKFMEQVVYPEIFFLKRYYEHQTKYMHSELKKLGLAMPDPNYKVEGTFYVLANIDFLIGYKIPDSTVLVKLREVGLILKNDTIATDVEIAYYLLINHGLSITPLSYFGTSPYQGYLRITCSTGKGKLDKILKILSNAKNTAELYQTKKNSTNLSIDSLSTTLSSDVSNLSSSLKIASESPTTNTLLCSTTPSVCHTGYLSPNTAIHNLSILPSPQTTLHSLASLSTPITRVDSHIYCSPKEKTDYLASSVTPISAIPSSSDYLSPLDGLSSFSLPPSPTSAYLEVLEEHTEKNTAYHSLPITEYKIDSHRNHFISFRSGLTTSLTVSSNVDLKNAKEQEKTTTLQTQWPTIATTSNNFIMNPQASIANHIHPHSQSRGFTNLLALSTYFAQYMFQYWKAAYLKSSHIFEIRASNKKAIFNAWEKFKSMIRQAGKESFIFPDKNEKFDALLLSTAELIDLRLNVEEYIKATPLVDKKESIENKKLLFNQVFKKVVKDIMDKKQNACTKLFWKFYGPEITGTNFPLIDKIVRHSAAIDYGHPEGDERNKKIAAEALCKLYNSNAINENNLLFFGGNPLEMLKEIFEDKIFMTKTFQDKCVTKSSSKKPVAITLDHADFINFSRNPTELTDKILTSEGYIILNVDIIEIHDKPFEKNFLFSLFNTLPIPKKRYILIQSSEGLFSTNSEKISVIAVFDQALKSTLVSSSINIHGHAPRSLQYAYAKTIRRFSESTLKGKVPVDSKSPEVPAMLMSAAATAVSNIPANSPCDPKELGAKIKP
jgi:aspartate/methionine/tyrosine aminotransferase